MQESREVHENHLVEIENLKTELNDYQKERDIINLELQEATAALKKIDRESHKIDVSLFN